MNVIPEVTCRSCGQKFSILRGRCPHCGARYVRRTMRSTPATATGTAAAQAPGGAHSAAGAQAAGNARWQLIFGGILIAAVIIAVIILITASLNPAAPAKPVETPPPAEITSPPPATPTPTPEPTPGVPVTSLTITFLGKKVSDPFTQRVSWAPIQLGVDVYPREALTNATVTWRSSDTSVATVDDTGLVTAVGSGKCDLIVECGGLSASVTVLVP